MSSLQQFELGGKQGKIIERLSRSMRWVAPWLNIMGIFCVMGGISALIQVFRQPISLWTVAPFLGVAFFMVLGRFFLALGNWTRNAARSFQRVVDTTGQDIDSLVDGLDNLRKTYSLLSVLVKIELVVFVLAIAVLAVALWT